MRFSNSLIHSTHKHMGESLLSFSSTGEGGIWSLKVCFQSGAPQIGIVAGALGCLRCSNRCWCFGYSICCGCSGYWPGVQRLQLHHEESDEEKQNRSPHRWPEGISITRTTGAWGKGRQGQAASKHSGLTLCPKCASLSPIRRHAKHDGIDTSTWVWS